MLEEKLNNLKKLKKNLSNKHRLLSKSTNEELNLGLMGNFDSINVQINENKKNIQVTSKQLDKVKTKLQEVKLRIQNFEIRYERVLHNVRYKLKK